MNQHAPALRERRLRARGDVAVDLADIPQSAVGAPDLDPLGPYVGALPAGEPGAVFDLRERRGAEEMRAARRDHDAAPGLVGRQHDIADRPIRRSKSQRERDEFAVGSRWRQDAIGLGRAATGENVRADLVEPLRGRDALGRRRRSQPPPGLVDRGAGAARKRGGGGGAEIDLVRLRIQGEAIAVAAGLRIQQPPLVAAAQEQQARRRRQRLTRRDIPALNSRLPGRTWPHRQISSEFTGARRGLANGNDRNVRNRG